MKEVVPDNIDLHGYACNNALKIHFSQSKSEVSAISTLEDCAVKMKQWMDSNRLIMNASKTEFILFGSKQQIKKCLTTASQ